MPRSTRGCERLRVGRLVANRLHSRSRLELYALISPSRRAQRSPVRAGESLMHPSRRTYAMLEVTTWAPGSFLTASMVGSC